jgi:4'-phosphopantetheinyl transferase
VTFNNDPDGGTGPASGSGHDTPESRDALIAELVDEMTAWTPRERMLAFRSWLKGSLSLIHLHVLTVLEADGAVPMSRLAETLDVSVASATGIVGRMEERGLVARTHGEADRRVVLVGMTDAGIAIFRDMTEQRRHHLSAVLERLTTEELTALLIGLRAMRTARLAIHAEKAEKLRSVLAAATVAQPPAKAKPDKRATPASGPAPSTTTRGDA